jgi:hypothetical protein
MARQATVVLYIVLLTAVVVGVDFLFFRNRFWERLMVNIGIVLVFSAFYLRFLKHPCAQRGAQLSERASVPSQRFLQRV